MMKIKYGTIKPTIQNLKEGQLGYFEKDLWINAGEKVIPIFKKHYEPSTITWEPAEKDVNYIKTIDNNLVNTPSYSHLDFTSDNLNYLRNIFEIKPFNSNISQRILDHFSLVELNRIINDDKNYSFITIELRKDDLLLANLYFGLLRYPYSNSERMGTTNDKLFYPFYPVSLISISNAFPSNISLEIHGRIRDDFDYNVISVNSILRNKIYTIDGYEPDNKDKNRLSKFDVIKSMKINSEGNNAWLLNQIYLAGDLYNDSDLPRALSRINTKGIAPLDTNSIHNTNYSVSNPNSGIGKYINLDLTRINDKTAGKQTFKYIINHDRLKYPLTISWDPRYCGIKNNAIAPITSEYFDLTRVDNGNALDSTLFQTIDQFMFNPFSIDNRFAMRYNFKFSGFVNGNLEELPPQPNNRYSPDAILRIYD